MMRRPTIEPDLLDRFRLRKTTVLLALGMMPLTVAVLAQSPETEETVQQEAPETDANESIESAESTTTGEGCPGCGRAGHGQGGGKARQGGQGHGGKGQGQQGRRHGGQMQGSGRPDAQVIHFLIDNHQSLERTVEEIPGGVRTRTVSQDPEIIDAVRTHVRQMVELIHGGGRIRNWDPLFREIFDNREAIEIEISEIEGGVEVTETSVDGEISKLIRAHAFKVEEFVARGREAAMKGTPLPEDYLDTSP